MSFGSSMDVVGWFCAADTGGDHKGRPCGSCACAMMVAWHIGCLRNVWACVHGDANMMASPIDATDAVWVPDDPCNKRWTKTATRRGTPCGCPPYIATHTYRSSVMKPTDAGTFMRANNVDSDSDPDHAGLLRGRYCGRNAVAMMVAWYIGHLRNMGVHSET